jgi:clan AA aspartic protease (TIGR02281 family)
MIFQNATMPAIILLTLLSTNAWGEGMIYKCKNAQGAMVYQKSPCAISAETLTSWKPKAPKLEEATGETQDEEANSDGHVLKLKQNSGGHYTSEGSINDKPLNFVIDTGASFVSLPEFIAHSANIYCDDLVDVNTANGKTDACKAKIKKLVFGSFQVGDVAAVIVPNLGQPLLGMNVLQLFNIAQDKGEMRISYQKKDKADGNTTAEKTETGMSSESSGMASTPADSDSSR